MHFYNTFLIKTGTSYFKYKGVPDSKTKRQINSFNLISQKSFRSILYTRKRAYQRCVRFLYLLLVCTQDTTEQGIKNSRVLTLLLMLNNLISDLIHNSLAFPTAFYPANNYNDSSYYFICSHGNPYACKT